MKLVLYSGGQERSNHILHQRLVELCGPRSVRLRMTYIPFCSEGSDTFFARARRRYGAYGVSDFHQLAVDQPFSERDLRKALNSDIIYLAGGNTFYFLHHLRKSRLIAPLRRYAREGGVLAGLSAGALILTPSIQLAAIPEHDADENEVGLKDLRSLGLTRFEFSPHYTRSARTDRSLQRYSHRTSHPIIACADGAGVVVEGDSISILGKARVFSPTLGGTALY